jgi:hypothetical protein
MVTCIAGVRSAVAFLCCSVVLALMSYVYLKIFAEIVDSYVRYFVFLWNILPENSCPLRRAVIPLTAGCSMGRYYTLKYHKFRYIHFSASTILLLLFSVSGGGGCIISIILKYE